MFVMDMPDVTPQYAPVVIAQASQAQKSDKTDRTIGVCQLIENQPQSLRTAINSMSPVAEVYDYLLRLESSALGQLTIDDAYKTAKINVLQGPTHGTLEELGGVDRGGYLYLPAPNYLGPDQANLLVEIGSLKVKAMYFFNVLSGVPDATVDYDPHMDKEYCSQGKGRVWKINF